MKKFLLLSLPAILPLLVLPPIHQSQTYHQFSNHASFLGIPNFWNVVSNGGFLLAAVAAALRLQSRALTETWKRICFVTLVTGLAFTALGSTYYHWHPSDATLLWDRLPMTLVFVSILTITLGERVDAQLAELSLGPLLVVGLGSVLYWRVSGDLRLYAVVQFYPLVVVPGLLLMPLRMSAVATNVRAQWIMIGFYAAAKLAELADPRFPSLPFGAHSWKHVLAAAGLFIYTRSLAPLEVPARYFCERNSENKRTSND